MEEESAYFGKCSQMKANVSGKSTDGASVVLNSMPEGGACTDRHYNACCQQYWKQYSYIASWIRNCQRKFSMSPFKPDFREWCQLMCRYHASMANYMQWNYLSMTTAAPQQLGYDWQNLMQSRLSTSVPRPQFHKKCNRGRKRRRRRSRARKRNLLSSAGDIELHIANIDPDGGGLDVEFGDGTDNLEFEFEITEDMVEFFAETARHRKERGDIDVELLVFIAHHHMRVTDIAILSVRLSVHNFPVSDENGLTCCHSFFHHTVAQSFWFYQHQTSSQNSNGVTSCGVAPLNTGGV